MNNLKNMQYGNEIITYLNNIKSEIELYNGFKLYNINKFAEYFYAEFLNLLFGYELKIMEKVNPNMVAIDLGDKNGKIAIQVTSDISREKIKETVKKFNENNLDKIYKRLVILHIANKTKNYNEPHIIKIFPRHIIWSTSDKKLTLEDYQYQYSKFIKEFNLKKDVWNIEYLLKQMPIESIDKLKNIRDFLKKYVEDSPQISNLDDFLKKRYKSPNFTKLRPLSSLNRDVYIEDIYQDLSIIKREKDEEITIDKILDDFQKVAILGKSGIGKSTLSKYICYQWANNKSFATYEYLFYIPIKKWEKGEGIFDVVLKVLKESNNENIKVKADDLYEYIKTFNNITLFVIDGLDEIRKEEQKNIKKEIQNFNNYIITSRHEGLNNSELNIKETFYNEGFNQKSIENFIKYIPNSDELLKQINSNNQLKELSKIPMLLDMICYLYKENQINFNSHFTMTSLYEKFLDEIIFRFEKEREAQSNKITKEDDDIFFELGKIAFDNLKDKNFKFKGTFITRSNRKFIENELLPFGFIHNLTNERHLKDREYEFIHNSFQEYFSAFYVSKLLEEEKEKLREIIQDWKFYPHMQMFFAFLSGLIEDKEFLLREIEILKDYIFDNFSYLRMLIFDCLQNIKKEELSEKEIKIIRNDIIDEFERTLNYSSFLKKLKLVNHFVDDEIVSFFIEYISEEYPLEFRKELAIFLFSIGRYDKPIINTFIEIFKDPNLATKVTIIDKKIIRGLIEELIYLGKDDEKTIEAVFSIIKISDDFHRIMEIFRKLLEKYDIHKNKIINFSIQWLREKSDRQYKIMEQILYYGHVVKSLYFSLKENDEFIDFYINQLREQTIEKDKLSISIFLYCIDVDNLEVIKTLKTTNPLDILSNPFFNSSRNKKLLNFIIKYYIEDESIDLKYKKNIVRLHINDFISIKDTNETIKKILKELDEEDKQQGIKKRNPRERRKYLIEYYTFLVSIQNKTIDSGYYFFSNSFQDNDIKLKYRVNNNKNFKSDDIKIEIEKKLFEKGIDENKIFDNIVEYIKKTDLNFRVKVNPKIKLNHKNQIIDALVDKLNKYYEKGEDLEYFFEECNLSMFFDNKIVVDIFFKIIQHPLIPLWRKANFLENLNLMAIPSKKIIDIFIWFIDNRGENFADDADYNKQIFERLIIPIKKINNIDTDTYNVLKNFIQKNDINNTFELIVLLAKYPHPETFLEDKKISENAKENFVINCSTENLLDSYKTEYEDMIEYIIYHLDYEQIPYYIKKDKKLYARTKGKEISTQEINKNFLNSRPEIKEALKQQFSEKRKKIKLTPKALIITEGKTDWKHLKKALERFQIFYDKYIDLNIEFEEYHDIGAGESAIDSWLKSYAKTQQDKKHIFIFDRDTPKYVNEYGKQEYIKVLDKDYKKRLIEKLEQGYGDKSSKKYQTVIESMENDLYNKIDTEIKDILIGRDYKEWQKQSNNQVYAFCIPEIKKSDSPRTLDKICIEFYYKEKDLKTTTRDGKRLFFADEFVFNKEHNGDNSKRFISKCGKFKTNSAQVKQGATAELTLVSNPVYLIDDKECKNNLLLSKNDFTKYIKNDVEGFDNFDIKNFELIFNVIKNIVND